MVKQKPKQFWKRTSFYINVNRSGTCHGQTKT